MALTLRPYQVDALAALQEALGRGQHPVCALPTGSGKSCIIAALAAQRPGRVLVVTHRMELLKQNAEQLLRLDEQADCGFYSAGLDRRETNSRIIFGGVQSIYRRMEELQAAGPFGTVLCDEAHLIAPRSKPDTMYAQVLSACQNAQRIAFTATPYRLDDGLICGDLAYNWFDSMPVQFGIAALTPEYLAPLRGLFTAHGIDTTGVRTRQGEYVTSDLSQAACNEDRVNGAMDELCQVARNRQAWLLFCVDVAHTEAIHQALLARGIDSRMLVGSTPADERAIILDDFREGRYRALTNCLVATTGFDIPRVDCIDLLRPSLSKSLVVQQVGRGTRQSPGKIDTLILDHSGNLWRHRPLDGIPVIEDTPARAAQRQEADRKRAGRQASDWKHAAQADGADPMAESEAITVPVDFCVYKTEPSRRFPGKNNLVVLYRVAPPLKWVRRYVCLEYPGGAAWHATQWLARRGLPPMASADAAVLALKSRRTNTPEAIVVRPGGKYPEVLLEHFPA